MTLKECRQYVKAWPERFRLRCNFLRGDDYNTALFVYALQEKKEFSNKYTTIFDSHPLGLGRNINRHGCGEWLFNIYD
jgi:hypothetical protein